MYALLRTSFLFFILTLGASAASEENINQQKDAAPGGKLVVDVDFGTINVVTGADDKVVIEAYRKIDFGDEAKEKEYFVAAPVAISQDGNIVTVRARLYEIQTVLEFWSLGNGRSLYDSHTEEI